MLPRQTFILGGARSGKSGFAERLVESCGKPKVYIASAQGFDSEMHAKIAAHQADRAANATDPWRLLEAPLEVAEALGTVTHDEVVLFDCATMWLSNHLLAQTDLEAASSALMGALTTCAGHVVVVSNEVGHSIVPENPLARKFRDEQGRLNQKLAAQAELAVLMAAGLPMVLKGQLPAGMA